MHILLVHQFFCTTESPHGTRHYELGDKLKHSNFKLTALSTKEFASVAPGSQQQWSDWLSLRPIWVPALGNGSYLWRACCFLIFMMNAVGTGIFVRRVDVVLGTTPSLFQAFAAWVIAYLKRKPFVLEIRDLWPAFAIDVGLLRNPLLIRLAETLEIFLYSQAVHIIVNSPAYTQYLALKGVPTTKVTLIANGADPDFFEADAGVLAQASAFRRDWNSEGRFVVVYTGAVRMANNLDVMLDAADVLLQHESQIQLVVVGDGAERGRLEAQAIARGLSNIRFVGSVQKRQIPAVLAAADAAFAVLRPIRMFTMTYPNKVFDYMAAGKPIVLCIDGVIREVVESSGAGIYASAKEPEEIAAAIASFAQNRQLAIEMGKAGQHTLRRRFNRASQARHFAAVFQKVLQLPASGLRAPIGKTRQHSRETKPRNLASAA